jgi:hypothetical protein
MFIALGSFEGLGIGVMGLLCICLWIAGLIDVLRRSDLDRGARGAWTLLIVLVPIVGTLVYFAKRPPLPEEREKIIAAQTRRHG